MGKSKIKTAKATRFDYTVRSIRDEEIEIVENPAYYREYDEEGNLTMEVIYGPGGYLSEKYGFVYKDGKTVEQLTYLDEETVAEHQFIEYHGDKISKIVTKYEEGFQDETLFTYDEKGRLLSKITYDDGEEGEKQINDYQGDMLVEKYFDEYGNLEKQVFVRTDSEGRITDSKTEFSEDDSYEEVRYEYDEEGKVLSEKHSGTYDKAVKDIFYRYDEKGNLTETETRSTEGTVVVEITYDKAGNEVGQIEKNEDGELNHKVKRKFDSAGNVTEIEVEIFNHGLEIDQHYLIKYEYEFY